MHSGEARVISNLKDWITELNRLPVISSMKTIAIDEPSSIPLKAKLNDYEKIVAELKAELTEETGSPLFHPAVHSSALEIALANALKESTRKLTEEKEKIDTREKKHAKEMEELKAELAEEHATMQAKMERIERIMLEILAKPDRPALVFGSINATDHSHDEVSHGASSRAAAGGAGHD